MSAGRRLGSVGGRARARPSDSACAGTPATPTIPPSWTHDVVDVRLEQVRGESLGLLEHLPRSPVQTRCPPICSDREPIVPVPRGTTAVSDCTSRTLSIGHAEQLGDDHRERRLVALPVRGRPDRRGDRAVVVRPRPRRTPEQAARGDLDVGATRRCRAASCRRARGAPSARRAARRSPRRGTPRRAPWRTRRRRSSRRSPS